MKTTTPPKDFDLTATLFSAPGYVPAKGNTSQLRSVREGYSTGELTAKLQHQGLITIRAMMLEAQFSNQKISADFACKYGAMMLLGGAWHSFAEDRRGPIEEGFEGTRRRLKLFDFTRFAPTIRPTTEQMHTAATEKIGDCVIAAGDVIEAVKEGYQADMLDARTKAGRLMGNTALHVAAIPLGDIVRENPSLSLLDMQVMSRHAAETTKADAVAFSNIIGSVPTPAAFADPMGSELQTFIDRNNPTQLADRLQIVRNELELV